MKPEDRSKQLGKKLLQEAKQDMSSRKKATDHNMSQALLDGVSHEVRQPITVSGDPIKAFQYRQKNKISCCICGITAGTFFIDNGKSYCSSHKQFIYMNEIERERELSNVS